MRKLIEHVQGRNKMLPIGLQELQKELQSVFQKKILSAGVMQPGYFNDFYPILEGYRNSGDISRYMISEEEHTQSGNLYKIPVIDVTKAGEQSNYRIFLLPL